MKRIKSYLFLAIVTVFFSSAVHGQTAGELLKDNKTRQDIFSTIINDSALLTEFSDILMKNPESCKKMMNNHMMMGQMMDMADKDSLMCKNMMQMMKQKPGMMKMMKEMDHDKMHAGKMMYTCPMHPEVQSAKPVKCRKCGMKLVKKTEAKSMNHEKMKM